MCRHVKFLNFLTFLFYNTASIHCSGIIFSKENIAVSILPPCSIEIRGEYFFTSANNSTSISNLFYPFPLDSSSLYPYSIKVTNAENLRPVPFTKNQNGIFFPVEVKPDDTNCVIIVYKQEVKSQKGTYILTTTHAWGRPLHNSHYSISIPQILNLDYLSYECDSVSVINDRIIYTFFKREFMPDQNLYFIWSEK